MLPFSAFTDQVDPVALAYWMAHPVTSTVAVPRMCSSTKSWVKVAPLLPPPP